MAANQAPLPWYAGGCPTSGPFYDAGGQTPLLGLSSVGCDAPAAAPNWSPCEPTDYIAQPGFYQPLAADGWYAGAAALLITRTDENPYTFSYDSTNESIQLTDSRDANMGFAGGVEMRIGRYFDCGRQALELVYWGVYPSVGSTITTADQVNGNLNGILNWDQLNYAGFSAANFVNNAEAHAVFRENTIQNIEFNLLNLGSPCQASCGGLQTQWTFGARYFLFSDHLTFVADTVDRAITGAPEELAYSINTNNHLIGGQVGGRASYGVTSSLMFDVGAKMGLYSNTINHRSRIGGAAGDAIINNGPFDQEAFRIGGSTTRLSFLGELNAGVAYRFSCQAFAAIGYRAVAVTGVALPTNQIYPDLRGLNDVRVIDANGDLVLHGAYAELGWNY